MKVDPIGLPADQERIQAKCFRSSQKFVEFSKECVEATIPDLFEQMVRRYPKRIAIKAGNLSQTYCELNRTSNRVAQAIVARRGEGSEQIAILCEHGIDAIAAILGVLKAGKTYVPLDPSFPRDRIGFMLKDSRAKCLVTANQNLALAHELADDRAALINIDQIDARDNGGDLGLSFSPDALAYILYTSGSTGLPKGVVQSHRNVLQVALRYTNGLGVGMDDRITLFSSCSTTTSVANIFGCLLNGATLYPYNFKENGLETLSGWLIEEQITIFHSFPTFFRHFVATLSDHEPFSKLRLVRLSGEPVYSKDVEDFKKQFSRDCILINGYGTSEMSAVCAYRIDQHSEIGPSGVPVGFPLDDTEILIVNEQDEKVEFNQIGEIALKSPYLFPYYWRRTDLTSEVIKQNPAEVARIYKTGDLGYLQKDGCLVHVGRKDFQVKIGGYRVEIAEIETALLELVQIKEVAVLAREDTPGGGLRLIAYIVPAGNSAPAVSELREQLIRRLPAYMIPSRFVFIDGLPLTPNGKVDRRALPKPDNRRPELSTPYAAARGEIEKVLLGTWEEILAVRPIGIHDNFFDLGGQSLVATQVMSRVCDAFGMAIPIRALFEHPTVAGLAEQVSEIQLRTLAKNELTNLVDEIESLSDDEVHRLVTAPVSNVVKE